MPRGRYSAARVFLGVRVGACRSLLITEPTRKQDEHVTITCGFHSALSSGIPSENDVLAAVNDMEKVYLAFSDSGCLGDRKFNFMEMQPMFGVSTPDSKFDFGKAPETFGASAHYGSFNFAKAPEAFDTYVSDRKINFEKTPVVFGAYVAVSPIFKPPLHPLLNARSNVMQENMAPVENCVPVSFLALRLVSFGLIENIAVRELL